MLRKSILGLGSVRSRPSCRSTPPSRIFGSSDCPKVKARLKRADTVHQTSAANRAHLKLSALALLLYISLLCGLDLPMFAAGDIAQARIDPRPISLPIID